MNSIGGSFNLKANVDMAQSLDVEVFSLSLERVLNARNYEQ